VATGIVANSILAVTGSPSHVQFVRPAQLDKFVQYKVTPSLYTLHTYYFAEAHIANRGKEQASFISPMRAAINKGLRPTNHTDFVVAPLDQMFMMWSAVNRVSRGGEVIGPDQRITSLEALKAMITNVAIQYGEQASKGSLEPGKLADLVILDKNPLKVDPMMIKDIKVLETIKEDKPSTEDSSCGLGDACSWKEGREMSVDVEQLFARNKPSLRFSLLEVQLNDIAGTKRVDSGDNFCLVSPNRRPARCGQHQNCQPVSGKVPLVAQVFVGSNEGFEIGVACLEEGAVVELSPTHLIGRRDGMISQCKS
jgi:hypothetical protein